MECQFIALDACARSKRLLDTLLASLPPTLDKTYERMLSSIDKVSLADVKRIFSLLCCARRPLTIPELIEGIAVELGDEPRLNVDGRLDDEDDIHRICPGLISVDQQPLGPAFVRIAHFSVQEYLESDRIREHEAAAFGIRKQEAHTEIATICLAYLGEPRLSDPNHLMEYPFATYAAQQWHMHLSEGDGKNQSLRREVMRLFKNARGELDNWVGVWDIERFDGKTVGKRASPLYYASLVGFEPAITELLYPETSINPPSKQASDLVNAVGGRLGTALQAAAFGGHETIVQLLLKNNADVNLQSGRFGTALQAASLVGSEKTVRLLLDNGADISLPGGAYTSPLQAASYGGDEKIVKLLLDNGADVNPHGETLARALQAASYKGHEKIVQLLLDNGADINLLGGVYGSALQAASYEGQEKVVQLLLDNGADVNQYSETLRSALQAASGNGHEKVVQLLLKKGADINLLDGTNKTALQVASGGGHEKVVQLLLNNGADVNSYGGDGRTALQEASGICNKEIVQLLLDKGADVNSYGGDGRTALQEASGIRNAEIVQLLLDNGADVNSHGSNGGTALQEASCKGHEMLVDILLKRGADINSQDLHGRTALMLAVEQGHLPVVKLLLAHNRIIQGREDFLRRPATFYAARARQGNNTLQVLFAKTDIDPNHRDLYGSSLLSVAVRNGYKEMVEYLLAIPGINAEIKDKFGRTPMWWATTMGQSHLMKLLGDIGRAKTLSHENNDPPLIGKPLISTIDNDEAKGWCDICLLFLFRTDVYTCEVCSGGDFWICHDCFSMGARCLDDYHRLKIQIEDPTLQQQVSPPTVNIIVTKAGKRYRRSNLIGNGEWFEALSTAMV